MLGKIASIGRRSSKQPLLPMANTASSRPSSPLMGPAMTSDDLSETDEDEVLGRRSTQSSMPGSFEDKGGDFPNSTQQAGRDRERDMEGRNRDEIGDDGNDERMDEGDPFDDGAIFDDDILATGEMKNVPF
jgi:phosphatidate phosphatase LPIN